MSDVTEKSSWLSYLLGTALGLAFSLGLFFITWNNALDTKAREFELASNSLKDSVARNVQTANDTLNALSSFLKANPGLSEQQYNTITASLLGLHPFMESAVYVTSVVPDASVERPFRIRYENSRTGKISLIERELLSDTALDEAINAVFETDSVITIASEFNSEGWQGYWILHAVEPPPYHTQFRERFGFVAILINTRNLVAANIDDTDLSVTLFSDSASLSGRQLLFQNASNVEADWLASSFIEEGITQFPLYSVRLSIAKTVLWDEIDKTMIFISMLIGAGITLLLVALIKSRDEQEQQLRERNAVIEAKVQSQTRELARTRDEALEASLMKSSFLASMSHEIRTPLNAIIGMSDLLSETEMDFEQKKYLAVFKKAGDTLLSLVNDILDLSKIEANQLQLEEIEFSLPDTVEESVEIYALKAAERSIELICDIDPSVKPVRIGDPSRLRQILLNLISNAIKFTDEGEIIVSVRNRSDENPDLLELSVKDTGAGISQDKFEKIFGAFTQADSSTTRKYGGTGLGLAITRRLIELMGGKIRVESELGKGSCFILQVGLPVVVNQRDNEISETISESQKIIVVDDNENYRRILVSYLGATGCRAIAVNEADQLLDQLKASSPQLVLIDAEMPGTDGFQLVKQIQDSGIKVPVLMMLNPSTLNQNQKKIDELGLQQSYLTKPVKMKELQKLVDATLHHREQQQNNGVEVSHNETIKPLRILLVDDNPDNRLLVKAYLKKMPYDLDEAENGKEAVDKYRDSDYDVVLMDVQMPVMDGREATRRIRQLEKQVSRRATPVIALTAHAIKEEVDLCFEAGCDTHLSKPVKKETLISTIQDITGSTD